MKSFTTEELKSTTLVVNSTTRLGKKRSKAMTLKPWACMNLARRPAPEKSTRTVGRSFRRTFADGSS
eukprot:4801699-Amphidinium_carterae.1